MRNHWLKRVLILVGVCALAWSGVCAQGSEDRSQNRIAREVQQKLLALPFYRVFYNLTFHVDGSTVTLLGQVTRAALKTDVEKAVKQTEGVTRVNNQVKVLPLSQEDDRIRLAVYVATYGQLTLNQYALRAVPPVHIIVNNRNVTLEGTADDSMDKTSFFTQASSVPGVVSVTNHLQIAP